MSRETSILLGTYFAEIVSHLGMEEPVATSVVVLSPHPDDDVVGCGGTLVRHLKSGCRVAVVYLTDGRKGDPTGRYTEDELAVLREQEAAAACREMGIDDVLFLRRQDRALRADKSTVGEIAAALRKYSPQRVYLPSFFDGFFHPDHLQTNIILEKAALGMNTNFLCYGYEIYTPLIPSRLVDITGQVALKRKAIEHHKSQLRVREISKIISLNEYRGATLGPPFLGYAEAFLAAAPQTYFRLFRSLFPS